MRILYISQYFPPEMGAPASRVSELARRWVDAGHEVTVITGFPNHPTGVLHEGYRSRWRRGFASERYEGVKVLRTWLVPVPNRKPWERILNYTSFFLSSCVRALFVRRPDVVIATSPQLLVGLTGWWVRLTKRVPFVFEVRDLWPDAIIASGVGSENSLLAKVLRSISGFLYRRADRVVVVTEAFRTDLVERWKIDRDRISLVPNGVETELFAPHGPDLRRDLHLEGAFVVSYIGTLGLAHGLRTVMETAAILQDRLPEAVILLIGEGADKERLKAEAQTRGLKNLRFMDQQPRNAIPALLRTSDACLVLLKKAEVFRTVIPTKMLEGMATGRPVVLGVEGQAKEILEAAAGGIPVEPEAPEAIVEALIRLHDDPDLRKQLGDSGRNYIEWNLSRAGTADEYLKILAELVR